VLSRGFAAPDDACTMTYRLCYDELSWFRLLQGSRGLEVAQHGEEHAGGLRLTPEQDAIALEKLKGAFAEYQRQKQKKHADEQK
jgi:hypothetical protein